MTHKLGSDTAPERITLTPKLTCSVCHKKKFECDVVREEDLPAHLTWDGLTICNACIERELVCMVFERVAGEAPIASLK